MPTASLDRSPSLTRARRSPLSVAPTRLSRSAATSLPQQIQGLVPTCAQSCLSTYISQEYQAICLPGDISCLCSHYGSAGFTLGELGLTCLRIDCGGTTTDQAVALYNVCSAQNGAVPATHSTLTVPATTATSVPNSGTTMNTILVTTHGSGSSHETTATALALSALTASATNTQSALSSLESTTAASTSPSPSNSSELTSAQTAGVSIAAFGAMAIAVAIVVFATCLRRRKTRAQLQRAGEKDSFDFIDEAPPHFSPFPSIIANSRGPLGGFGQPRAELADEKMEKKGKLEREREWEQERDAIHEWAVPELHAPPPGAMGRMLHEMDESTAFENPRVLGPSFTPTSYRSRESLRTMSRLLPEKPTSSSFPPRPFPTYEQQRLASPLPTPATVFEEEKSPTRLGFPLPPVPLMTHPAYRVPIIHSKSISAAQNPGQSVVSPESPQQPTLSLAIPPLVSPSEAALPNAFPPPPPIPTEDDIYSAGCSTACSAASVASGGSFLNYYASPYAGTLASPELNSATPIEEDTIKRRAVPMPIVLTRPNYLPGVVRIQSPPAKTEGIYRKSGSMRRKNSGKNGSIRDSHCSDTSFESNDLDDATPPEEEYKQLSPVVEHSPISMVRYPKIPRSSNQAVPRSPLAPTHSSAALVRPTMAVDETYDAAALKGLRPPIRSSTIGLAIGSPVTPQRHRANTSDLSGSTLAVKHPGDHSLQDPERKIQIDIPTLHARSVPPEDVSSGTRGQRPATRESPLKGYGRVTSGSRSARSKGFSALFATTDTASPGPTVATITRSPPPPQLQLAEADRAGDGPEPDLKSPPWEPKLTPERRGDDLFLNVTLATPR